MKILNLTQHAGTPEQGVTEPTNKTEVQRLLTFDDMPARETIVSRAKALATLAESEGGPELDLSAMIGGAPFLMSALEQELLDRGITPLYAFSRRETVEQANPDGSVRKVAIFRHLGFVPA